MRTEKPLGREESPVRGQKGARSYSQAREGNFVKFYH